jgi:hypothetical protein
MKKPGTEAVGVESCLTLVLDSPSARLESAT